MLSYINTHILPSFRRFNRVQLPNLEFTRTWQVQLHLPLSAGRRCSKVKHSGEGEIYPTNMRDITHMAVCQNLVPLVNIKIAGKWMFIPLELIIIGFDPSPYHWQSENLCVGWMMLNDSVSSCRKKKRMCFWHLHVRSLLYDFPDTNSTTKLSRIQIWYKDI